MRKFLMISLALGALTLQPAHAYVIANSGGTVTSTPGATTFATFDAPDVASIGTTTGGTLNLGTNPLGGGNWKSSGSSTSLVANLNGLASYFGFLWGTNDGGGNRVDLYSGVTHLATLFGIGGPNSFYNITASNSAEYFDRVVFNMQPTSSCCFEVDNLAAKLVPAPATLPLLGLGLLGFAWHRRRKA